MSDQNHPDHALRYDTVRDGPIMLTVDQAAEVAKRQEVLQKLLANKAIQAKYKLEVLFGKARSNGMNPTPGMLSFWENGTKLHGGGDVKLYICPGQRLKRSECTAVLQDSYNEGTGVICPACGTIWKHEQLIGEFLFNLPMRKWAEVLHKWFRHFEHHCDIYLKYAPADIRSVTKAQTEKATWKGSQILAKTRDVRAKAIYPLRNIVVDLNAGADLEKRIYAFLVA